MTGIKDGETCGGVRAFVELAAPSNPCLTHKLGASLGMNSNLDLVVLGRRALSAAPLSEA